MAHHPGIFLLNFEGLVKNRKGPFAIILKNNDGAELTDCSLWKKSDTSDIVGFDYLNHISNWIRGALFSDQIKYGSKIYLTTSAGNIELTKANFKPEVL